MTEVVSDKLYAFACIQEMGGYGVSQGMDGIFGIDPCFLCVSLEKLMHSLSADVALSACEQRIAGIQPLLEIFPDELFGSREKRSFSADPALDSVNEYPFVFQVNV